MQPEAAVPSSFKASPWMFQEGLWGSGDLQFRAESWNAGSGLWFSFHRQPATCNAELDKEQQPLVMVLLDEEDT